MCITVGNYLLPKGQTVSSFCTSSPNSSAFISTIMSLPLALPQDYSTIQFKTILVHGIDPSTGSTTRSPRVIQIVINRLSANNAFTQAMALEIRDVYALFDVDERVRCIILTGAGDKFFCAGADLNANERTLEGNDGERERDYRDG